MTHIFYGVLCEYCNWFKPELDQAAIPLPDFETCGHLTSVLVGLAGFAAHTPSLHHLGLHSIVLSMDTLLDLGYLLGSLPPSVTTLTPDCLPCTIKVSERVLLFEAIARTGSLRQLCMPRWEKLVGGGRSCVCGAPEEPAPPAGCANCCSQGK